MNSPGDFGREAVWDFFDSIDPISDIPEGACFGSPRLSICDGSANSETIIVTRQRSGNRGRKPAAHQLKQRC
jgi:hypothetical protein